MQGHNSDTIAQLAEQIHQHVARSRTDVPLRLPLPGGQSVPLTVIISRDAFGERWGIRLSDDALPCKRCPDDIRRMESEWLGSSELKRLLEKVVATALECGCLESFPPDRSAPRTARSPQRINLISQDARGTAAAPPPARKTPSIRINSAPGSATPDAGDYRGATSRRYPRYPAISLRYESAAGVEIGVIIPQYACERLAAHCDGSNWHGREVGGILVGYSHEAGARLIQNVVTDIIPIGSSDSSGAHFRLTENDWLFVQRLFDARYTGEGKTRLGWYHTHPTQGVFFSDQDADFHTVFRQPHQCAVVVDPRRMEAGLFYWVDYDRWAMASPLHFALSMSVSRQALGRASRLSSLGQRGTIIKNWISRALPAEGARAGARRERPILKFVLTVAALAMVVWGLWRWWPYPLRPTQVPLPRGSSEQTGGKKADDAGKAQPETRILFLTLDSPLGGRRLGLQSESPAARIEYVEKSVQGGAKEWRVNDANEKQFFETVFQLTLSATATDGLKALQQSLGMALPDGEWGKNTRKAFLERALSKRDLTLNLSEGRSLLVQFR